VAVVASLHQVHLARAYADRILALRAGSLVQDAPTAHLDVRALEQIYERSAP
jgi:phosphonate transport system ATP-binding protein